MRTRARPADLLLLLGFAFLAHGMLLLNDGIYWDDWLLFPHLQSHDWPAIDALVHEAGMTPLNAAFLHIFAYAPGGVFSFKLTVFILILCIASLVYLIALEAGAGRLAAIGIATLQMAFPGFQDWVLLATAASVFDFALFLLATFMLVRAEAAAPRARLALRVAAIVAFVLSFGFNSLLPLYFGSLLLLLIVSMRSASVRDLMRSRWLYAAILILLPVAYFEVSRRVYAPSGLYGGVYAISTNPAAVITSFRHFVRNGILEQVQQSVLVLLRPWTWLLTAAFLAILIVARNRIQSAPRPATRNALLGIVLGIATLGLGMLPYALVGKSPAVHGWDSRHDLLLGLPLAILIVSLVAIVLPSGRRALLGFGLVGLVVIGFTGAGIQDYAAIQARWATDQAVMTELASATDDSAYSVYWVHDNAPGPEDFYRFYEWSGMLGHVYGDESRIGLDVRHYDSSFLEQGAFFSDRYNLAHLVPHGCEVDMTITRTSGAGSSAQTALMYTFDRLLQPGRLDSYVRSLVTIQIVPVTSALASSCSH